MRAIFPRMASLLFAGMLCSAAAFAQSGSIYFPYVVNDSQTITEIILTNAAGQDAMVTLTRYPEDGTASSQISVSVAAYSQFIQGPDAGFKGWVIASSDSAGIAGNLRVSSPNRAAQDTTATAQVGTAIILPIATQAGGATTEIALVNPTANDARVSMTVYDKDGRSIVTTNAALSGFGMLRGSIGALFGIDKNYNAASHVIARFFPGSILSGVSEISGMGFEVVRGFVRNDRTFELIPGRSDWAAFTATPMSAGARTFTFPHATRDFDWFSLITLVNASDDPENVTLTYSSASNPNAGSLSISLPPNGAIRGTATDLFGRGQDSGFVRVAASANVAAFMSVGTFGGSAFTGTSAQSTPLTEFFFPGIDETNLAFTGIALLNDNSDSASAELFLISPSGETVGATTEVIPPRRRLVTFLSAEIRQALNTKGGYLFIRSSAPLFGELVSGIDFRTLNEFTARPTVPGFVPPPLQGSGGLGLAITGNVKDYGIVSPAAGVTLTLSRPGFADITTTTDASGGYAFKTLSPGEYTVKPIEAGRGFLPPSATVQLSSGITVMNFSRGDLPILSSLTVITTGNQQTAGNNPQPFAIFGTSEVTIRIDGKNFIDVQKGQSGQKVYFGSRAVPAATVNFVDTQTVYVRLVLDSPDILAELAPKGFYGSYDITVSGQPPFDTNRSNALPFFILPPLPVLTSVDPQQTTARYEINSPGQALTIEGFGFRPGARLLFDGQAALNGIEIDTIFVSSTLLRAYLPPQALLYGGMYTMRVRNVSLLPEISGEAIIFQVNNLRPVISHLNPPGPIPVIGPGPGLPLALILAVNGSNFFPKTGAAVTLRNPAVVPALVPVNGAQQCIRTNGQTTLRVRLLDNQGQPVQGVPVTFASPGINTNVASGAFLPGNTPTMIVDSDAQGFAPALTNAVNFQANPFPGNYIVTATTQLGAINLATTFSISNTLSDESCGNFGAVVFIDSNQIVVTPSVSEVGTYSVIVSNDSPGGGFSNEVEFQVTSGPTSGVPTIRPSNPLSPAGVPAGSAGFNLTVFRDLLTTVPFLADAWVNFGTVRLSRIAGNTDSNSITVFVPSFLVGSPGTLPLTVTNPGSSNNTGGTSTRVFFTVGP